MSDAPERIWAGRWLSGGRAWRETKMTHIDTPYVRADLVEALETENKRLCEALTQVADELDEYYRFEYPLDHPIHERERKYLIDNNPARTALKGADQ